MKRREPLSLAHVLEDRHLATIPVPVVEKRIEKRIHTRFDKAFLVMIGSELYGDTVAVARNISAGGILVEMTYAPPMGTLVTVHFQHARDDGELDEIVARAEVKHHHYLNFTGGNDAASSRAIGLRFVEFLDPDERIASDRVH
ncbi:MAG TPA: PilZ domain-containing protein [Kofleriaceae bacterium]|nr:PilZ domain-containing protein [Kofleriaceae bacterium]